MELLTSCERESLEKYGGIDRAAFDKLCGLLRYVGGDYNDAQTFAVIRKELRDAHIAQQLLNWK